MARILLIGGDSDFNVGDAAIQRALCSTLVRARRDIRISIVAARRLARHELPDGVDEVVPKGSMHALSQWLSARRHQLVLIGGGGLFQDDDSRIKMPYWAARLAALRSAGRAMVAHGLGAGPLRHAESRMLAQVACRSLQSISVRDPFAHRALQPCTSQPVSIVPDAAFALEARPVAEADACLRALGVPAGRPLIGVVVRQWFHPRGGFLPHRLRMQLGLAGNAGRVPMEQLLQQLSQAIRSAARRLDAEVLLLPSYLSRHEGDLAATDRLQFMLDGIGVHVAHIGDPALYKAVAGRLALLVSARMHPLILAAEQGVPLVGLAYNGKFNACLEQLGAADQLLDIAALASSDGAAQLRARIDLALSRGSACATPARHLATRARAAVRALLEVLP